MSETIEAIEPARMTDPGIVRRFVGAGNARLTLRSKATGTRFTYRIRQPKTDSPHFVGVLTGSDNEASFSFLGTIFQDGTYRHGTRSMIAADAPSAKAFPWFWERVMANQLSDKLEVWHEGRCCRCGRALTVPESIATGIGPECAKKVAAGQ